MRIPFTRRAAWDLDRGDPVGPRSTRDIWSDSGLDRIPPPEERGKSTPSTAGKRVSFDNVVGLTAALRAVRLLAETMGQLDCIVVRDKGDGLFEPAPKHPAYNMLARKANEFQAGQFYFWAFIMASLQGYEGAYLQKVGTGKDMQLVPADPRVMHPQMQKNSATELEFIVRNAGRNTRQKFTRENMIYIPSILLSHPFIGVSPITAQADAMGLALAAEEFASDYMRDGQIPPGIIEKGPHDPDKRKDMREGWRKMHSGRHHEIGILWGEARFTKLGISAADAQLIESRKFTVDDIARAFAVPPRKIGGTDPNPRRTLEEDNLDFLVFSFGPWPKRIADCLWADDDLFPDKQYKPLFLMDNLFRADMRTVYDALHVGRQSGLLTINEGRGKLGLKPVKGGDEESLQKTPVGGESNPVTGDGDQPEVPEEDETEGE